MIRKYARLDVSPETVRAIFRDVEQWPSWMPTIASAKVLERADHRTLVEVRERMLGQTTTRKLELVFDELGHTETQVAGRLKHWKTVWRFTDPPMGPGTVVSTLIDIDLGLMRFLVPKRAMQRAIDHFHEEIVRRVEARARRREALRMPTVWGVLPGQKLSIRVYETPTELEIWFGERRFVAPAAE